MRIGIIDADLLGRTNHRFPNLACMKISAYYKNKGCNVELLLDYNDVETYDKVFISKVFTDTQVPENVLKLSNVQYGGTGFYYANAPKLTDDIEHTKPDYELYTPFVNKALASGVSKRALQYYTDYSIGYTTRGCIRGCSFCVNANYRQCLKHSPVTEFIDDTRPYICLLDDNVLACKDWEEIFKELTATGKRFQFKQGLDERLLTPKKIEILFNSPWVGDYIFAFDNIRDKDLIESKLKLIRDYTNKKIKFYCFCGYNHTNPDNLKQYDDAFWAQDIRDLFERMRILFKYEAYPYVMRHQNYKLSPYKSLYATIAAWANQPNFLYKFSLREYCEYGVQLGRKGLLQSLEKFEKAHPDVAQQYFNMKWKEV